MSTRAITLSSGLLVAFTTFLLGLACPAAAAPEVRVSESYGKLPLHFEANQGQTHKDVRFLSRGPGYSLYLTAGEAVLVLTRPDPDAKLDSHSAQARPDAKAQAKPVALRMSLVGAARKPLVRGLEELPGKANYLIGNHPAQWRTNVPTYAKVHYSEVYPGIDLVYYGNQRQLEYDFVVAPGADPKKIVLGFKGAERLEIDAQGELVLHTAGGAIRQNKPVIYQEIDGVRQEIPGSYVRKGAHRVGFQVAAYDRSRPLVIDPVVLSYSTYLGGNVSDVGASVAVDSDGNAYVTGYTNSLNFPVTSGAFESAFAGGNAFRAPSDAFVTKLDPTGSGLVYSTYLGGSGSSGDVATAIAVDAVGNAYITGYTNSVDFPTTPGAFQPDQAAGGIEDAFDAFVTKLDPTGSALYSTYLGGSHSDTGYGIAVGASGHTYVTGWTTSVNFPTTPGAFQSAFGGDQDAFVTELNPAGSALVYSTFLGGTGPEIGNGIAVDADGNAYVTGWTTSVNFPTTPGAFQSAFTGSAAAFVTGLNPAGSALVYSTFLGGTGSEVGDGIAVDASGHTYVTGRSTSVNFPTTPGAFQPIFGGDQDAFVTKLNPTALGPLSLVYSTYLGGSGRDWGFGIAVDAAGNAYVTGVTSSTNFPTTSGAFQPAFAGGPSNPFSGPTDAFVTKLNPAGSGLVYSSYLGGSNADGGFGIAVDTSGNAYVTGHTSSLNFPITSRAFQPALANSGGGCCPESDAFVAKITDVAPPTPFTGTPFPVPGTFEAEDFDHGGEGVAYHDNVPGNAGGRYRTSEDVDIIVSSDSAGGGYVVNNAETGEWLAYTINVATSGNYDIELRASTNWDFPNAAYHAEIDGVNVTGTVILPNTGGWSTFQWVGKKTVSLSAGTHVLKIVIDRQYFALNSIRVLPTTTRSEERAATYTGSWNTYGSETGTFSGGTAVGSPNTMDSVRFSFIGTAVTWIGVKCAVCGIATVSIDGGAANTVNTAGPANSNVTSEPVFSASGLASGVSHTMVITVTGTTTSGGAHVVVDAFDVTTDGTAAPSPEPPLLPLPPLPVVPLLPPVLGL